MKKVAKIFYLILTIMTGVSLVTSLGLTVLILLALPLPMIGGIVVSIIQASNIGKFVVECLIPLIPGSAAMFFGIVFVVASVVGIIKIIIKLTLYIVCMVVVGKAKSKKGVLFPMIFSFAFGGYLFIKQNYLHAVLNLVPAILLAASKKESY